jgi:O-antigen/teichoic acid export membrane protein
LLTSFGTVLFALRGFGVWSFVVPVIVVDALSAPAYWMVSQYAPGLSLRYVRQHAREIINYGKFATGNSVLSYIVKNADYLLIGKLLNPVALGFYTFAYEKSLFLSHSFLGLVNKISFPAFSLLKENNDELSRAYVKLVRVTTLFTFPLILFAMMHGDILIIFLFGSRWMNAVVPFQLICVYALVNSLTSSTGSFLYALGRPDVDFKLLLVMIPFLLIGFYVGATTSGIIGVAAAIAIIQSCFSMVKLFISFRLMNWRVKALWEAIARNLLFASMAALASWLVRLQIGFLNNFSLLVIVFLVFAMVFLFAKLIFDQEGMGILWGVLLPQRIKVWSIQNLPYWLRAGLNFPGARKAREW